jgi:transposase-like protein
MHGTVNRMLREAYRSASRKAAKGKLLKLVAYLEEHNPDAAESLREGLDETLTLKDLKLPAWLERTFSTTNAIENLNGSIRRVTRNVKRWRDGRMVRRWVAAAILEAERGFHRLRGYRGLPLLLKALGREPEQTARIDRQRKAA